MPAHVNISGTWKQVNAIYVRTGGVWKEVPNGYVDVGGVWKQFHSGVTPFTTAWKSAGAGTDAGGGDTSWSNSGNITASDDSRASTMMFTGDISNILRATNFGFTTSDIPSGATIFGIEVGVERSQGNVIACHDFLIRLRTSSGQSGDNKSDTGTDWPPSDSEVIYGGPSDDWNAGLSDSDVRGSDFGLDLRVEADSDGGAFASTPSVDHIRIRVHGEA